MNAWASLTPFPKEVVQDSGVDEGGQEWQVLDWTAIEAALKLANEIQTALDAGELRACVVYGQYRDVADYLKAQGGQTIVAAEYHYPPTIVCHIMPKEWRATQEVNDHLRKLADDEYQRQRKAIEFSGMSEVRQIVELCKKSPGGVVRVHRGPGEFRPDGQ